MGIFARHLLTMQKDLKKRATHEIEKWHCMACRISETPPLPNRIVDSETLNTSDTLLELEMSLIENNLIEGSNSREDDLQMAAKIGSALVAENELLKSEKLALQSKLISMEGKLEEMENIESKYLTKIENLLQLNSDIQAQLENEKKLRIEIQNSSEDNDLKLGQMIDNYAKQIVELEKSNSILQEKIQNTEITAVVCKSSYSQTSPMGDAQIYETNQTAVLLEISKMNSKLDQMELSIKTMASSAFCQNINDTLAGVSQTCSKLLTLSTKTTNAASSIDLPITHVSPTTTPGVSQTCRKKLNNTLTTSPTEKNPSPTSGVSQTCNQKLFIPARTTKAKPTIALPMTDASLTTMPGVSQTCSKKLKHTLTTPRTKQNLSVTTGMSKKRTIKTNQFSVSLQVAKAAEKSNIQQSQLPTNTNRISQSEATQTSTPITVPESQPEPHEHFLVHTYQKQTKFKTRYFINSNLKKAPEKI
ncbi:hypothetical protein J6590_026105 [Homalodisca vitripennis]|nr:hypothetical protein J6590_026105 [Homalodisca vitripennis]